MSRRAVLAGAVCAGMLPGSGANAQVEPPPLPDMLDYMVQRLGAPRQSRRMSAQAAQGYKERIPPRLVRFWQEVGLGSYFGGLYWICEPGPFDPLLAQVFKGDREFAAADMAVVSYTAFSTLSIWDRRRGAMKLYLNEQEFFWPTERSRTDTRTGERFPEDYLIANAVGIVPSQFSDWEHELFREAQALQGPLEPGDVYGFFPAPQLGGTYSAQSARRVKAAEHFSLLAQLGPIYTTVLSEPSPPAHPYGLVTRGRKLGQGG